MLKKVLSAIWTGIKKLGIGIVKGSVIILVDFLMLVLTSILCMWWYGVSSGYLMMDGISFSIITVQMFMIGALMTVAIIVIDKKISKLITKSFEKN